jgi:RNA polymerase sigma-70 factor, ECF subfamily
VTLLRDDRALLDAFRRGERDALARVYRHYFGEVAAIVRRGFVLDVQGGLRIHGCRDPESERDLIQETFVRAFNEGARLNYDGLRPYRAYLLRITKNLMIDRARSTWERKVELSEALVDEAALAEEPEATLDLERQKAATYTFVQGLSPKERRFVALRYEEGLSQEDVAARMKITRRGVRTLEAKIETALVDHLKKSGLI